MPVPYTLCRKLNCSLAVGNGDNCSPDKCPVYQDKVKEMVATGLYTYNPLTFAVTCNTCGGEAGDHLGEC